MKNKAGKLRWVFIGACLGWVATLIVSDHIRYREEILGVLAGVSVAVCAWIAWLEVKKLLK